MKPQSPQRNTLRTLKDYPFKDIHIAHVLTYLKGENIRVGLLINFYVDKIKDGIKKVIL
jgi:hypothetical protein